MQGKQIVLQVEEAGGRTLPGGFLSDSHCPSPWGTLETHKAELYACALSGHWEGPSFFSIYSEEAVRTPKLKELGDREVAPGFSFWLCPGRKNRLCRGALCSHGCGDRKTGRNLPDKAGLPRSRLSKQADPLL